MRIGVPKEIKKLEFRVGLTPDKVKKYVEHGHTVYVQKGAGIGSSFPDADYIDAGATILSTIEDIYQNADMIIKVKEPLKEEYPLLREGQIVYAYFHLAASLELTEVVLRTKIIAIAYETIEDEYGGLPCLRPMSAVAGRLAIQEGAKYLEKPFGGRGVLLGGVPGVKPGTVVVLGAAGTVGRNAVQMAIGLQADVIALDVYEAGLMRLKNEYGSKITTMVSNEENVRSALMQADLVVSGVLIHGDAAPKLVRKEHLKLMKPGSVIVDVAIDQGGSTECSRITYHDDPIFQVDGVNFYCVGNMPGAVPNTSSEALNNATIDYGLLIADFGYVEAFKKNPLLALGLNAELGVLTNKAIGEHFHLPYTIKHF